jgi:hypothetical protein
MSQPLQREESRVSGFEQICCVAEYRPAHTTRPPYSLPALDSQPRVPMAASSLGRWTTLKFLEDFCPILVFSGENIHGSMNAIARAGSPLRKLWVVRS